MLEEEPRQAPRVLESHPLVVNTEQAWLLNSRVRDLLEQMDLPAGMVPGQSIGPVLVNPQPLALQIIRALKDLQTISETSIIVCEAECWYLERRFRHNDRDPEARALLLKIHELILEFHPDFSLDMQEVGTNADKTYRDAIRAIEDADANKDTGENPPEDAGTGESTGDGPILSE